MAAEQAAHVVDERQESGTTDVAHHEYDNSDR
jgi:hypothetical protein